jgi:hypothetical protein
MAYLPMGAAILMVEEQPQELAVLALAIGLPGVALLGAGLAPAALESRVDAIVAGIAFGIGSPVAAVTSIVIGAFVVGAMAHDGPDLTGPLLRAGVTAALGIAPLVALCAAAWVLAVRRLVRPAPESMTRPESMRRP